MSILNPKDQVVDIELTKYGRKLLGMGIFQPKYYYFYDDSIIYDYSYFNEVENTNNTSPRILNESLTFNNINTSDHLMNEPLGNCKLLNDYAPSWDLKLLNGNISYDLEFSTFYKKIFNFADIIYSIQKDKNDNITLENDYILLDLKELNVDDDLKNFEIEIITYDEISGGKNGNLERKLHFTPRKNNIIDDIIYDDDELPNRYFEIKINENNVSYYLDVLVDDEIDTEFLVPQSVAAQETAIGIYTSNYIGPVDPKC